MRRRPHTGWLAAWMVLGCTTAPSSTVVPASTSSMAGTIEVDPDEPRLGRYVSSPWGFSTVSYWIEGDDGVVLVDTQFLPSATEELVEAVERRTGKDVVTAIVLHANPDKFNGTATLQRRGIEVLTSEAVREAIPEIHAKRVSAFAERYAPDYPRAVPWPDTFAPDTTTLRRAGLQLRVHQLGPGCSRAHVAVQWREHLFVGDLVAEGSHSWLELGLVDAWRARLAELAALGASRIHPGRGASGGPRRLADEDLYLQRVQTWVAQAHASATAGGATADRERTRVALGDVRRRLERAYPTYAFAVFLDVGLPAVWRAQRGPAPHR